MSKVFLVSSNTMIEPYPVYPLGMAVVASALTSAGHTVRQFDLLTEDRSVKRLIEALIAFNPDFVGISMRNIDTVDSFTSEESWTLDSDREIIHRIKENTKVPVILGGSAFSIMPEEILDYVGGDYGIVGDGGMLFNHWIELINRGKRFP